MSTTITAPRPTGSSPQQRWSLTDVIKKGGGLPNRFVLHGVEGWGKTSFCAQAPSPIFFQTRGETGLETLIDAGRLPETPHLPEVTSWQDLRLGIKMLTEEEHPYKTFVLDALNGAERLCHEFVCQRDFDGKWGDNGFMSYNKGYEVALPDWQMLLNDLDKMRQERRIRIFLICHTKVANFKNPVGPDYDRFQPDMNPKTWSLTHKWADVVLFGNFDDVTIGGKMGEKARKGKGAGGTGRVMYTQRTAAYDAKNRLGLEPEIDMGDSAAQAWANFTEAVKRGMAAGGAQ